MHTSHCVTRLATGLLLFVAACAGPAGGDQPRWIVDPGSHPDAPADRVLSAVGSARGQGGAAVEQARAKALMNLSTALTARVVGEIELDSRSRTENGETSWTDELVERARIQGAEDLPGVERIAAHHDPSLDETHVLLAVRRDRLRDLLLDQVAQGLQQALAANGRADALQGSAPARALLARLEAWQAASDAYQTSVRAWVAGNGDRGSTQARRQAAELDAATSDRLADQLGALRFGKLAGDDQLGHPRGALAERLVTRVDLVHADGSSEPVPDLPVRFRIDEGLALLAPGASTTDVRGEITCAVSDLARAQRSVNTIRVELDTSALAPDLPAARVPAAEFVYRLPSPGATRLLVALTDGYDGQPIASSLPGRVVDHLSAVGFHVETPNGGATALVTADLDSVRAQHGESIDYVLRGGGLVERGTVNGGLQWLHLSADIEVVALRTGQTFSVHAAAKGAGRDDSTSSASQAIDRYLVGTLLDELDARFVADFVPAEEDA